MNVTDVLFAPAAEIARLVGGGDVSARAVTEAFLARVEAVAPTLNCFITVMAGAVLEQAQRVDAAIRAGMAPGPLAGVPIGIKDIVDVAGVPTTAGAHRRFHSYPHVDAPVVTRLRNAGAVIIGKTSLHEVAYGVTNVNPHFGPTRNPWDLVRIPGGSSGGSAAAVAAGLCAAAIGTDTGGSIRIPAALCGVVGIKPTYDVVPRTGVRPLSWTLDHIGPLTRTVRDAALLLTIMAGEDTTEATKPAPAFDASLDDGISRLRVGVPRRFFWEHLHEGIEGRCEDAVRALGRLGAEICDVEMPHAGDAGSAVAVIIAVEAAAVHEQRLRADADAFGEDVRIRLERGFFVSGTDFVQAQRARTYLTRTFVRVLEDVDILVMPTTSMPAPSIEEEHASAADASLAMSLTLTRFTNPFNLTGLPALSVPCGFTAEGLPVGLQIVGRPFDDATVLRVGHAYEEATEWHTRRPPLTKVTSD